MNHSDLQTDAAVTLLKIEEVAKMLAVTERTVWRLKAAKAFPQPVRIGHSTRWFWSDIQDYLEKLKQARGI